MSRVFSMTTMRNQEHRLFLAQEADALSKEYGRIVNRERVRLNLSIRELAQRADLEPIYIRELENATTLRSPTLEVMFRIARPLKRHPAELLPISGGVQ